MILGVRWWTAEANDLAPPTAIETVTNAPETLGTSYHFGFTSLYVRGRHSLHITGAHVDGTRPSVRLTIEAAHFLNGGYPMGLNDHYFAQRYSHLQRFPIDAIRLSPGVKPDWYLLITMRPTEAGTYALKSVTIDYTSNGRRGHRQFPFAVQVTATPRPRSK